MTIARAASLDPKQTARGSVTRFPEIQDNSIRSRCVVHGVRERWVMRRTAVVNQIRGLILERGLTLPKGRRYVDKALPEILADAALRLSDSFRVLLPQLGVELINSRHASNR
jgi:transposase